MNTDLFQTATFCATCDREINLTEKHYLVKRTGVPDKIHHIECATWPGYAKLIRPTQPEQAV